MAKMQRIPKTILSHKVIKEMDFIDSPRAVRAKLNTFAKLYGGAGALPESSDTSVTVISYSVGGPNNIDPWKPPCRLRVPGLFRVWCRYATNDKAGRKAQKEHEDFLEEMEKAERGEGPEPDWHRITRLDKEKRDRFRRANPRPSHGRKWAKRKKRPPFGDCHGGRDSSRTERMTSRRRRAARRLKEEMNWSTL